jgi:hypothetical protein
VIAVCCLGKANVSRYGYRCWERQEPRRRVTFHTGKSHRIVEQSPFPDLSFRQSELARATNALALVGPLGVAAAVVPPLRQNKWLSAIAQVVNACVAGMDAQLHPNRMYSGGGKKRAGALSVTV